MTVNSVDYTTQINNWTEFTQYLSIADNWLPIASDFLKTRLSPAKFAKVDGVIRATFDAIKGVYDELVAGIADMRLGEPPRYEFPPLSISGWPSATGKPDLFLDAWNALKPVLEIMLNKTADSAGVMGALIAGLISKGDECVKELEPVFNPPQ